MLNRVLCRNIILFDQRLNLIQMIFANENNCIWLIENCLSIYLLDFDKWNWDCFNIELFKNYTGIKYLVYQILYFEIKPIRFRYRTFLSLNSYLQNIFERRSSLITASDISSCLSVNENSTDLIFENHKWLIRVIIFTKFVRWICRKYTLLLHISNFLTW